MSDYGFGDPYFDTRDRLSQVMRGILELAADTATVLDPRLPLGNDGRLLDSPLIFAVFGEVNAGKSSFANGLLGASICETSELPDTRQPLRHHAHSPCDSPAVAGADRCPNPAAILRDIEIIDTPGIQNDSGGMPAWAEGPCRQADLIFCVFPVSNPWAPGSWNFLAALPPELTSKVVVIVQQADQRQAQELAVVRQHVTELAGKKLDRVPPIFTISAHQALQANASHQTGSDDSGYAELKTHLTRHIRSLPSRHQQLQTWLSQAANALTEVEDRIEAQARRLRDQNRFMDEVSHEIDGMRESFIQRLPIHLVEVAKTFESEAVVVSRLLHRKLGAVRSMLRLFCGDRTGATIESVFIERIRQSVDEVSRTDSDEALGVCKQHWLQLAVRIETSMGVSLTAHQPIDEILASSQEHFKTRLGRAAEEGVKKIKVRNQLDKELLRRNLALRSFVTTTLILTTAAATCGALEVPWVPWILLAMAGLFLSGGIITAWLTRRTMIRDFKERLLDTCGDFAQTLHTTARKPCAWSSRTMPTR